MLSLKNQVSLLAIKLLQTNLFLTNREALQTTACLFHTDFIKPLLLASHLDRSIISSSHFRQDIRQVSAESGAIKKDEYSIVPITPEYNEEVFAVLRQYFYRDAPLHIDAKQCVNPEDECIELKEHCRQIVDKGLSMMAVTSTGSVIGVLLNEMTDPEEIEKSQKRADTCTNPKVKKRLMLLAKVEREMDILSRYPHVTRTLKINMATVIDAWRDKGVGVALGIKTRELAKKHKFQMLRVDSTNKYVEKGLTSMGFQSIYTLRFEDYKDEKTGEPIFTPPLPHVAFSTFVQFLED